jgi:hypothetical protein
MFGVGKSSDKSNLVKKGGGLDWYILGDEPTYVFGEWCGR